MKISLHQISTIKIPTAYGLGYYQDVDTLIPGILTQNGDRFDVFFDPDTSAFGDVIRDEKDTKPVSENNMLIAGMTVGFLAALRDRKFLMMRE